MKLYAGLDTDGIAKIFSMASGIPRIVEHDQWIDILHNNNAVPGEMLRVQLWREDNFPKDAEWNGGLPKWEYKWMRPGDLDPKQLNEYGVLGWEWAGEFGNDWVILKRKRAK